MISDMQKNQIDKLVQSTIEPALFEDIVYENSKQFHEAIEYLIAKLKQIDSSEVGF